MKITAVIPLRYTPGRSYNGKTEPFLNQKLCIEALLCQDCFEQVIVVNHTPNYVSESDPQLQDLSTFYRDEPRIKFIDCGTENYFFNQSWLLNVGLKQVTTPYFMRIDIDCILSSEFESRFEEFVKSGGKKFLVGQLYGHAKDDFDWTSFRYLEDFDSFLEQEQPRPSHSHIVVSTEALKAIRGYDEMFQVWGAEDDDVYDRLRLSGYEPVHNAFKLLHQNHTIYSGSILGDEEQRFKELRFEYLKNKALEKNHGFWGGTVPNTDLSYLRNNKVRPLNILLIGPGCGIPIPPKGWGGIEKVIWKHMDYLRAAGQIVTVFNERDEGTLRSLIQSNDFDIIHAHEEWGLGFLKREGTPDFLFTSHSGGWAFNLQYIRDITSGVPKPVLFEQMCNHPELEITARSIFNGADSSVFYPDNKIKGKCVAIGRNEPRKKFAEIARVVAGKSGIEMYFIGPGCESLEIANNIHALGNLPEEEVARNIRDAEYFFHLAEAEADALAVREAAMAGCKLILSSYCAESVSGGVAWTDYERFDECPEDLGARAAEHARSFDWNRVGERLLTHYREIVASRGVDLRDVTVGAYLQLHTKDDLSEFALLNFRKHYPDSPVYLVSDKGDDFSDIAKRYDCKYEYSETNTGVRPIGFTKPELIVWLNRLKSCFEHCSGCDYILYMEDDVYVRGRIKALPKDVQVAGVLNPPINPDVMSYVTRKYGRNFRHNRYGTCGGALYHRETFLQIFDDILRFIEEDFDKLVGISSVFGNQDIFIPVAYTALGCNYDVNMNLIESSDGSWGRSSHPIVHIRSEDHKRELMR